jgi:hypothetical protein
MTRPDRTHARGSRTIDPSNGASVMKENVPGRDPRVHVGRDGMKETSPVRWSADASGWSTAALRALPAARRHRASTPEDAKAHRRLAPRARPRCLQPSHAQSDARVSAQEVAGTHGFLHCANRADKVRTADTKAMPGEGGATRRRRSNRPGNSQVPGPARLQHSGKRPGGPPKEKARISG